jgi:iron complex outermembrane recepter protein
MTFRNGTLPKHPPTRGAATHGAFRPLPATHSIAAVALTCVALTSGLAPVTAHAAPSGAAVFAAQRSLSLPAQPLGQALNALARTWDVAISVDATLVSGRTSPPLQGAFTLGEALERALAGSGMVATPSGSAVVVRPQPEPIDTLAPVKVTATVGDESGTGPVPGYVARRSAVGTKTGTPLIETPQSVSVVTRDQMDDQGAQTVPQALRYTSGVQVERNGADQRTDYLQARGFAMDQYLDGMPLLAGTWALPQIDAYGLERIDVVKGPSSVLYGQAAPGGLANYTSKRPQREPLREVTVQLGNRHRAQMGVDLTGPLTGDGRWLYRLTALGRSVDTQVDGTKEQRSFVASALTWAPDASTSLTLLASHLHDPESGAYYKLPAQGTLLPNPNGVIPTGFNNGEPGFGRQEREQLSAGYLFEHRFDEALSVRQNFRYMRVDGDYRIVVFNRLQPDLRNLRRFSYAAVERHDGYTLDNQLLYRFDAGALNHALLFGLDLQHSDKDQRDGMGTAPDLDFVQPVYGQTIGEPVTYLDQRQKRTQTGLYVQDLIAWRAWRLMLAGRQDWVRSETEDRVADVGRRTRDKAFTKKAGLLYLLDNGFAPYASYTESFQPVSGTDYAGTPFKPTRARQYEAGLKYQPGGGSTLWTASLFNLEQRNVLTADADPAHLAINPFAQAQTGAVRSKGFEIEGKFELNRNWRFTAAYSNVDSEITRSNDGLVGKAPVYQPRHSAAVWAHHRVTGGALAGLDAGLGVRRMGATFGSADNSLEVPAYTLADLALGYDLTRGARIAVFVNNLFDKTYVGSCQNINTCYYGARRSVQATLKYAW